MGGLILGPMLRYVSQTEATVWVETDEPCEVEVLGGAIGPSASTGTTTRSICLRDLEPGSSHEYEVKLDGERAWPPAGRLPAERPAHPEPGRRAAHRLRLVPRRGPAPSPVHADQGRGPRARPRDRRALRARPPDEGAAGRGVAGPPADDRRPGLRRRGRARDPGVHPRAPRHRRRAGRRGRRLRGVHAPLSGDLGRRDDPLAALRGARRR